MQKNYSIVQEQDQRRDYYFGVVGMKVHDWLLGGYKAWEAKAVMKQKVAWKKEVKWMKY